MTRSILPLCVVVVNLAFRPSAIGAQSVDLVGRTVAVSAACHPDAWGYCRKIRGTLLHRDSTKLVLDGDRSIPLSRVRWLSYKEGTRHPIGRGIGIGAVTGFVVGAAIGVAVAEPCRSCFLDYGDLAGAIVGGSFGLLAGGLIGAAVASGVEVDRWHRLSAGQLAELGVPQQPIAIGMAAGYEFPQGAQFAGSPQLVVRGSPAPRGNSEPYAELSVRRVRRHIATGLSAIDSVGAATVVGISVGTKVWVARLGAGRVLPYGGMSLGYETGGTMVLNAGFRVMTVLGIDVFASSASHFFVETRVRSEDGVGGIGLFGGAKFRVR